MFTVTWVIQAGQSSGGATRNARSTVVSFQLQLVMAWMLRAGVAVVAGQGIGRVHAARGGIARIRRGRRASDADVVGAGRTGRIATKRDSLADRLRGIGPTCSSDCFPHNPAQRRLCFPR